MGDTDHLNAVADNPCIDMQMVREDNGYTAIEGELQGPGPIRHTFRERDSRWVRGTWFVQEREIRGPVLSRTRYEARLVEDGDAVVPEITLTVDASNGLIGAALPTIVGRQLATWQAELNRLPAPGASSARVVRRLPKTTAAALTRWRAVASADLVDAVAEHLQSCRARELRALRPFSLARAWGIDRRALLVAMIEGAKVGALELYWAVRCTRCDAAVAEAPSLSNLADHAECDGCQLELDSDLADNVEVLFAAPAELRPAANDTFCTLFPADRPDVLFTLTLEPGSTETHVVPVPSGRWTMGIGGGAPDLEIIAGPEGPRRLAWRSDQAGRAVVASGPVELTLTNPTAGPVRVRLAGETDRSERVSAAWLSTMPEYRRAFGAQALAPDVRLSVKGMAILFTDLSGSAALYHEQGDAGAFALVHEQFGLLEAVVERFGGVRVKTIGDALMAAFVDPASALSAALAMQEHFASWANGLQMEHPPGLKVGVHYGPVMAVHTDQAGLDYFGGTVNLAARCEGQASRGDVIWTHAVHASPGADAARAAWQGSITPFRAQVKGIPGEHQLYRARR